MTPLQRSLKRLQRALKRLILAKSGDINYDVKYPRAGSKVDGRDVGRKVSNIASIAASLSEYEELAGVREFPMSDLEITGPYELFYAANDIKRSQQLAEVIKTSGRIDPLIIVIDAEGPYILEGAHRVAALHILGAKAFPALIVLDQS